MKDAFSHFKLDDKIMKSIKELGFKKPTPIQSKGNSSLTAFESRLNCYSTDRDRQDSRIWTTTFATN